MCKNTACSSGCSPLRRAGTPQISRQLDGVLRAVKEKDRRKCFLEPELSRGVSGVGVPEGYLEGEIRLRKGV